MICSRWFSWKSLGWCLLFCTWIFLGAMLGRLFDLTRMYRYARQAEVTSDGEESISLLLKARAIGQGEYLVALEDTLSSCHSLQAALAWKEGARDEALSHSEAAILTAASHAVRLQAIDKYIGYLEQLDQMQAAAFMRQRREAWNPAPFAL